jgi:hypothetical protein
MEDNVVAAQSIRLGLGDPNQAGPIVPPELNGPVGQPTEAPPDSGGVMIQKPNADKTVVCWNCLSVLIVRDEWNVVECSECHKLNRVPHEDFPGDQKISLHESYNHFDVNIPYVFGIVVCPYCRTENRFRRDADHIVCYKCHHSFNVNEKMYGNVSYNFPLHEKYRFSDLYPDIINWRGYYPQPLPIPQCNCRETEEMLQKILKTMKKKNKEDNSPRYRNFIPYPMFNPFMFGYPSYNDLVGRERGSSTPEIQYIPIKEEPKETKAEDEGFKITIRKKPRERFNSSSKVSKSAAFEKIFYTK